MSQQSVAGPIFNNAANEARTIEATLQVSTPISTAISLDKIFQTACKTVVDLMGVNHSSLVLFDSDFESGTVAEEHPEVGLRGTRIPLRGVLVEQFFASGEPHVVPDVREDPSLGPFRELLLNSNILSVLLVPIINKNRVLGFFALDVIDRLHSFENDEVTRCQVFASFVAVAIDNAKLLFDAKQKADQLNEQKCHLDRLAASAPNNVIAVDSDGNVTVFNNRAEDLFMYQCEDVLGKPVGPLYDDPQEPRKIGKLLHKSPDGKLVGHETLVCGRDGERIPIRLAATWLYDAQGKRIGSVGHFEDLRTIKKVEKHLAKLLKTYNFITKLDNSETGLQSLAEMMVTLFKTAFCRIFLADDDLQFMTAKAVRSVDRGGNGLSWRSGLGEQTALVDWPGLLDFITNEDVLVLKTGKKGTQILEEWTRRLNLNEHIQSLLVIPLRTKDRVIGLLELGELRSWDRTAFSHEDRELAVAIGSKIAELIDHLRVHEVTERRKQLLTALDESTLLLRGEKEPSRLLHEVVRMAAELAGCQAGGLYINHPNLKELVLSVVYNLPDNLLESRLSHSEGLVGHVARTHESKVVRDWPDWNERENILEPFGFNTVIGIPLTQAAEVDAVLFVADPTDLPGFIAPDLEILEKFVAQASIALQTSRLISPEQRRIAQLEILHEITESIHTAESLDKILHIVLTGITAGYSLGFNRAVLLGKEGEYLVGRMGIGQFYERDAWNAWEEQKLLDFSGYIDRLENDTLPKTPLDEIIDQLKYPVNPEADDVFSQSVLKQDLDSVLVLPVDQLKKLPRDFHSAFKPTSPVVVVPLKAGSQVLGLLVADNKFTLSPITSEVKELLLTLVNTAAMVIHKVKLLEQTRTDSEKLRSLCQASSALVSSQDPKRVLHAIVEQTREEAKASWAGVVLIDESDRAWEQVIAGNDEKLDLGSAIRNDGISMSVMRTGRAEKIEDTNSERDRVNPFLLQQGVAAALCLPLSLQGKQLGVVWINYESSRLFSDQEIEALRVYVNHAAMVAVAVCNSQLYERANKRASALSALSEAGRVLTSSLDEEEILNRIAKQAWRVANSQGNQRGIADVRIVDGTKARLLAAYPIEELSNSRATLGKEMDLEQGRDGRIGIIGRAFRLKKSVLVGDVTVDPDYLAHHESTRSELAVPIPIGDEIIGMINIEHFDCDAFDEEDRGVVECLAAQASIAIQNARRYKDMKETQMYVGSRTAVDWMKVIADRSWHRLHHEVHQANLRLRVVQDDVEKISGSEQHIALLEELRASLLALPDDPMMQILQDRDVIAPAEINDFLDTVLVQIWQDDKANNGILDQVELAIDFQPDLDEIAVARISQMHLRHVLTILIENSTRAMLESRSQEKRIFVSTQLANQNIEISISDTGPGIPLEIRPTIFDSPITKEQGRRGAGMGCTVARCLLDLLEGRIALKSSGDDGTTVVISLPVDSR